MNTPALQGLLDELRRQRDIIERAISVLEELGGSVKRAKKGAAKASNGDGANADAIHNRGVRKSPYPIMRECDDHGSYLAKGSRSRCPQCVAMTE